MHRPLTQISSALAIGAVCAALLTGCASRPERALTVADVEKTSTTAPNISDAAGNLLDRKAVDSAILPPAAVQAGWSGSFDDSNSASSASSNGSTVSPSTCKLFSKGGLTSFDTAAASKKPVAKASESYSPDDSSSASSLAKSGIQLSVASFRDTIDPGRLSDLRDQLKLCRSVTLTTKDGVTGEIHLYPVSMPNYGDQTLAFRLQASISIVTLIVDATLITKGHNLVVITQTGLGGLKPSLDTKVASRVMQALDAAGKGE
jgi:hypothetical protein